jgi:hypothetical protein
LLLEDHFFLVWSIDDDEFRGCRTHGFDL